MRIAIDARSLYTPTPRGIGKTLALLYRETAAARPEWRFTMFHRDRACEDALGDCPNVNHRAIEIKGDRLGLWQALRLPWAARRMGADLLHCPANIGPRWPTVPMVLTVHDLIPLDPEFGAPGACAWGKAVARSARKARKVLTPSEFSKGQLVQKFGIPADKISVCPWAANPNCRPMYEVKELTRVLTAYGLNAEMPYLLAFGGLDPRKNTRRILDAWAKVPLAARADASLVVIGVQEPLLGDLQQRAREMNVPASVRLRGYVPEKDLSVLLSRARGLCFPSLSEGFGLPILDAFACGTAVMTSRLTSLPEVAGDAALYVDPRSTDAVAEGMSRLLVEDGLCEELVGLGRERLKGFTWSCSAELFCTALDEVL